MILTLAIIAIAVTTVLLIWDLGDQRVIVSQYESRYRPFTAETSVQQVYKTKAEQIWDSLVALPKYNLWFPGVQRIFPIVDSERYVHRYSFDQFDLAPGSFIRIRPNSFSPSYRGRILTMEKNKELTLEMRFNPLNKELVTFQLDSAPDGTTVTCSRSSRGPFSFLSLFGFAGSKSHILANLGYFIPEDKTAKERVTEFAVSQAALTPEQEIAVIAHAVQAGLDGNMDPVNAIASKVMRGKTKSAIVRAKRAGGQMPDEFAQALKDGPPPVPDAAPAPAAAGSSLPAFDNDADLIAFVVNKALSGDMDPINSIEDKALRGKAKSTMVKAKRSGNAPPMPDSVPETAAPAAAATVEDESEEDLIQRLVQEGLGGNMDSINAIEDRILRGKVKSALVKAKRAQSK